MNAPAKPHLEDLNVIAAGQGGDGSLTVVNVLADVLRSNGMRVYTERDVLSRIKGGITAATLRAFAGDRLCIGSHIDLLVAFDLGAVRKHAYRLNDRSVVIYDNSGGGIPGDWGVPAGARLIGVPLHALRRSVKYLRPGQRDISVAVNPCVVVPRDTLIHHRACAAASSNAGCVST